MTQRTVAALVGAGLMAIAPDQAHVFMQTPVPDDGAGAAFDVQIDAAGVSASITIEAGQRFAVQAGVAVVPVRGILTANAMILERYFGWATYQGLRETLAELSANEDVRAIVMLFDTPGGSVLGLQGAVDAVREAAQAKPVLAVVDPLCASAGYHLASQATEISLAPGAWVGSIGVIYTAAHPVAPGATGLQMFMTVSSNAQAKRPDPTTEEGRALIQQEIDNMESKFLADVAAGRGIEVDALPGRLAMTDDPRTGGGVFWGQDAKKRGLVDRLETGSVALARIMAKYGRKPKRGAGARALASAAAARAAI